MSQTLPPQTQERQPGRQDRMQPQPRSEPTGPGSGKLKDRVAFITGGDSGIGRAVAVAAANEGANVSFVYLEEKGMRRKRAGSSKSSSGSATRSAEMSGTSVLPACD